MHWLGWRQLRLSTRRLEIFLRHAPLPMIPHMLWYRVDRLHLVRLGCRIRHVEALAILLRDVCERGAWVRWCVWVLRRLLWWLLALWGVAARHGRAIEGRRVWQRPACGRLRLLTRPLRHWCSLLRLLMPRRAQLSWPCPHTAQSPMFRRVRGRWRRACGVGWQRSPLHRHAFARSTDCWALTVRARRLPPLLYYRLFLLRAAVVVCDLHADLAGVLALAIERVPVVALSAAWRDDRREICPRLSNQLRLLVVVEDGELQAVVVGRVVNSKAQFLVPAYVSTAADMASRNAHHLGVWPPRLSVFVFFASLPSRAAQYGSCLPIVRLLGRFRARSMMTTSVPMTGPSTVISATSCMLVIGALQFV